MRLELRGVDWGSIGDVIFFRKRLAGCWLESRHAQLVSRQFQSDPGPVTRVVPELDGLSRQPILGVHMLSMTHREAAIFDDACTVPTPCLLLPDGNDYKKVVYLG